MSSPSGRGSSARLSVGVAVVATGVYLVLAVVSGHLSPFARRPMLDGFGQPQPYRWVSPPPTLAHGNQRPASASDRLNVDPQSGSEANVVATSDLQVSLAFGPGAFPPKAGFQSVRITITPKAPAGFGRPPAGQTLFGNVYVITAHYEPGGPEVSRMASPGQITLFYPGSPDNLQHTHRVLQSNDGRTWRTIATDDFQGAQQASASVMQLGYYAVAQSGRGTKKPLATGRLIYYVLLGIIVVGGVGALVMAEVRTRRRRRERDAANRAAEERAQAKRARPQSKSAKRRRRR